MPAERMNYCRALGLNPFKEAEYDEESISAAIAKSVKSWEESLQKRVSARIRHQNWVLLQSTPEIHAVMGNDVLRKAEFEKARGIISLKASHLKRCTVTTRDGTVIVIPTLANKAATALQWNGIEGKDLINASGIANGTLKNVLSPSVDRTFSDLRDIGFYTPYEFVNHILRIPGMNFGIPPVDETEDKPDAIFTALDAINAKKERFASQNVPDWEAYNNVIIKLHGIRTAKEIAELTLYGKTFKALEPVLEQLDVDSGVEFSPEFLDDVISNNVTGRVPDLDVAVYIMEAHCLSHGYPANFSGKSSRLTLCPSCGALTEYDDGACSCAYCSAPVRVICPKCGEFQSSNNESCVRCGVRFSDALATIGEETDYIRDSLRKGLLEDAEIAVMDISSEYPHADGISELSELVADRISTYASTVDGIMALYRAKRFNTLKNRVESALVDFPYLCDTEEIKDRYDEAVRAVKTADEKCRGATCDDDYISAAEICPDHPDALSILSTRPPEGPADGEVSSHSDGIVVRYAVPEDRRGITFCIYRGIGAYPEVNSETTPTFETDKGVWLDTEAEPGSPCYYRVYSRRWGVLSEDYAEAGPGVLIRDVTNVTISQLEDGLRVKYSKPAGCRRVRVWRKISGLERGVGDETEVDPGDGVFEDRGLTGRQTYAYLFVAEYADGQRSAGTVFRAETPAYPDPVTDMKVVWDKEARCYSATWSSECDVTIYSSSALHGFSSRAVPACDVESWLSRIEPVESRKGGAVFNIDRGYATFLTPVITVGTTAIIGDSVLVANLRPLSHVSKTLEDGIVTLRFPWPDGSIGVIAESDGERITIGRGDDEDEGVVRIPIGNATRRSVSLSAIYDVDGANMTSSVVTTDLWGSSFAKIRYSVSEGTAVNDRKMSEVTIKLNCPGTTSLPRMVVIQTTEGIPIRPSDGRILWTSDDPILMADGKAECRFFMPRGEVDVTRIRLFFSDRAEYGRFRVIHPLYRRD